MTVDALFRGHWNLSRLGFAMSGFGLGSLFILACAARRWALCYGFHSPRSEWILR
jgi:hypothetical protein